MELTEREGFITALQTTFAGVEEGEGHCVFISGEAGIGKTSLVKAFCREKKDYKIFQGTCDALFTPRPLAPLYDIALQTGIELWAKNAGMEDRAGLFARFLRELNTHKEPIIIVFEDIHWADEATLDFIKFFARRITYVPCLFLLTYRDDAIDLHHPLRNVLGQLAPDSFTRLQLTPLSRCAVEKMAAEKGYRGEDVYSISGGNPFYVSEILASYSIGIPDNIKDSILTVYNRVSEKAKKIWEMISVFPAGLEVKYIEKIQPLYAHALEDCFNLKILLVRDGVFCFKHELYRRTIEASLSPFVRITLNKTILDMFLGVFEENHETERIIHHAKNANEYGLVVSYAPQAAKQAASLGAHIEACRLYLTAIEYYQGKDAGTLIKFYEGYAYECYLTSQVKEAIIYTGKALNLWKVKGDTEQIGNCLRFLSRLWWFEGNRKKAEYYGMQAVEVLDNQPPSRAKAMTLSNMSQLKMLSDQADECIYWGEKAIAMAKELGDEEILAHAYNNVGVVQVKMESFKQNGISLLQESLKIALKNGYQEHVARAYTNLGNNWTIMKDYAFASANLEAGIQYCEERDLDSWTTYMQANKARLKLETGYWAEAANISEKLSMTEGVTPIVKVGSLVFLATIKMRRGEPGALAILQEAKVTAFETMELHRIIPVMVACLEYEWITGESFIDQAAIDNTIRMTGQMGNNFENNEFAFWLYKVRKQRMPLKERLDSYDTGSAAKVQKAAAIWQRLGCNYLEALVLFDGNRDDKRKAVTIIQGLGATAVYEKMKLEMKASGIKNIPRGLRKATLSNPAFLTEREIDVLHLLHGGMQNKEIATQLFISAKTVDHHISSIFYKLEVNTRVKAVRQAVKLEIIK